MNTSLSDDSALDPERTLALSYAPAARRAALAALFALDDALAQLMRTTSQPAVAQLRLAWWRDALAALDHAPAPAQPVLRGLEADLLPLGVRGGALVPIVHGWEVLVEEDRLDPEALRRFAEGRGLVFEIAGAVMGGRGEPLAAAGQGWALADLANHLSTAQEAEQARALARPLLVAATTARWGRPVRALGALAHLAGRDLSRGPEAVASPQRVGRMLWHRLTGR